MNITVILTCFNRKEKTEKCIRSIVEGNKSISFKFIIVDDNSTDGTREVLKKLNYNYDIKLLIGDGNLFWSGGMHKGIDAYLVGDEKSDYVMLVNDDVAFFDDIVEELIYISKKNNDAVVVGATCDESNNFTYGAMKLIKNNNRKSDLYYYINPNTNNIECDMFNANCVLIKNNIILDVGNFDSKYKHSLADLDYGFMIKNKGYKIVSSSNFVGICERNSIKGTWQDTSLTRIERFKRKESVKGAPFKQWFYFMKKNFGIKLAIRYSISPYIKILLGK